MQRSLFDRIYIAFLVILITSFIFLLFFISYFARRSMLSEKRKAMENDGHLVAANVTNYLNSHEGQSENLHVILNYFASTLDADIWYISADGTVFSTSTIFGKTPDATTTDADTLRVVTPPPNNIFRLEPGFRLEKSFSKVGTFHGTYNEKVLTVNVPINYTMDFEDGFSGSILLNSSIKNITGTMRYTYSVSVIPCLFIIAISFLFLSLISRKIIRPVRKLSVVAEEYSKGNFDTKANIQRKDEIGQLASNLEYMASELSKLEDYRRDFVSNISHDFRSPLTSIRGYVQAMLDGTIPPEKQERYLNIVLDETQRLTKLTQGLLDLNRLQIYGTYLKLSEFDFIDIIRSTLNTFEIKCIDRNISIYLNNHAENTMVAGDKTKIQQVVYNLIDNAIKFTPEGKKIYVTINELDEKLQISIKDEGIGMSESTQKKIWTRFYKDDASRGMDKHGTGLGLAITKEIIKAHNETIEVKSTLGEGSEFVFTLKKVKSSEPKHTGNTEILIQK